MIGFETIYTLGKSFYNDKFTAEFYPMSSFGFYSCLFSDDAYHRDCVGALVAFDSLLMSSVLDKAQDMVYDSVVIGQGEEFELDFALCV